MVGDLLGGLYYLPKGAGRRALVLGADENGVVQNDFFAVGKERSRPVLAHAFINFMLDEKNAYDNFVNFTGYMPPPRRASTPRRCSAGPDPEDPRGGRRAAGPVRPNQELLQLSVTGQRYWDDAWSKFKAG